MEKFRALMGAGESQIIRCLKEIDVEYAQHLCNFTVCKAIFVQVRTIGRVIVLGMITGTNWRCPYHFS